MYKFFISHESTPGYSFKCIKAITISKKDTRYPKRINESQGSFPKMSQQVSYNCSSSVKNELMHYYEQLFTSAKPKLLLRNEDIYFFLFSLPFIVLTGVNTVMQTLRQIKLRGLYPLFIACGRKVSS